MAKREAKREIAALVNRLGDMDARPVKRHDEADTSRESILLFFRALRWGADELKGG